MDPYRNDQEAQLHAVETLKRENNELTQENQALRSANEALRNGEAQEEATPAQTLLKEAEYLEQTILRTRAHMKGGFIALALLLGVIHVVMGYLSGRR